MKLNELPVDEFVSDNTSIGKSIRRTSELERIAENYVNLEKGKSNLEKMNSNWPKPMANITSTQQYKHYLTLVGLRTDNSRTKKHFSKAISPSLPNKNESPQIKALCTVD